MVDFQSREPRTRGDDEDDDDGPEEPAEDETQTDSDVETPENEQTADRPAHSGDDTQLSYAIVSVTAQRTLSEDTQGDTIVESIENTGATVTTRELIQPSYDGVQSTVDTLAIRDDVDVVVTIGGTGVEPSDVTVDALEPLFGKRLPGFGELFRRAAVDQHGTAVVGSRATAGLVDAVPVFAVPGSIDGAIHAVEDIIIPEAPALVADAHDGDDQ